MNLSDFKLLKEDDNSYDIGHPSGRAMKIAKQGMSDKAHEAIKKLKGPSFEDGGETGDTSQDSGISIGGFPISQIPNLVSQGAQKFTDWMYGSNPNQPTEGGASGATIGSAMGIADNQAAESQPTPAGGIMQAVAGNQPQTSALKTTDFGLSQSPDRDITTQPSGFEQYIKGLKQAADITGRTEKENARLYQGAGDWLANQPSQMDIINQYADANQKFANLLASQQVDPNRYWHNKSTGSKILAGIGLLASGMGSGTTGQPNLALGVINKAIDNDIDAQKNAQNVTMNLWKMNREKMGSNLAADAAAKSQQLEIVKYIIAKNMAQSKSDMARAMLNQQIGQINYEQNRLHQMMGASQVLSGQVRPSMTEDQTVGLANNMKMLSPELSKSFEDHYVPGVGIAQVPVKPEDREAFANYDELQKNIDAAKNFAATHGSVLNPLSAEAVQAEGIMNNIKLQLPKLVGTGRMNEFFSKKFDDLVKSPGAINTPQAIQSFKDIEDQIKLHRSADISKLNVMPFAKPSQQQQAAQYVQQNINSPDPNVRMKAQQILQRLKAQ